MWIMITVLLPMSCLFAPIFRLMHVQVEIAHIAANFMQHAAFGIPVRALVVLLTISMKS